MIDFLRCFVFRLLRVILLASLWSLTAWADVDVNQAAAGDLESLPGIGPVKAAAIIDYRTNYGPFKSLNDLDQVPGIGPATLTNITPHVTFSGKVATTVSADGFTLPVTATTVGSAVNINAASAADLQSLSGIGPSKAAAIVADRIANGPFETCSDLQRVKGIGPATIAGMADHCTTR